MAIIRELITRWGFNIDLDRLEELDRRLEDLQDRVDGFGRGFHRLGERLQGIGTRMSIGLTAPIVGFGALSLRAAGSFEQGMNRVDALVQISGKSLEDLREQAKKLGRETQFSATQAAQGMGFMAQAGLESSEIFDAMPHALRLAGAAQIDLATTADILTNVMDGMGIKSSQVGGAVDVIAKAFVSSNTDLTQLGEAMKQAGPVARGFKLSLEETTAVLGLMGNAGIQASLAGTSLKGALVRLASPSGEAEKILRRLGVTTSNGAGGIRNLIDIMTDMEVAGASATEIMEVFGMRAGPGMSTLLAEGTDKIKTFVKSLKNSKGTAEEIQKKQLKGLFGQITKLKSAFEGLSIAIAESGLLEFITKIARKLTDFVSHLAKTNPRVLRFITIVAGIVAVIGPALIVIGSLIKAVVSLGAAFAVMGKKAALATFALFALPIALGLIIDDYLTFKEGGDSVLGRFLEAFPEFIKPIAGLVDVVKNIHGWLVELATVLIEKVAVAFGVVKDIILVVKEAIESVRIVLVSFIESAVSGFDKVVTGIGKVKRFITGEKTPLTGAKLANAMAFAKAQREGNIDTGPVPVPSSFARSVVSENNINVTVPITVTQPAIGVTDPESFPEDLATQITKEFKITFEDLLETSMFHAPKLEAE